MSAFEIPNPSPINGVFLGSASCFLVVQAVKNTRKMNNDNVKVINSLAFEEVVIFFIFKIEFIDKKQRKDRGVLSKIDILRTDILNGIENEITNTIRP